MTITSARLHHLALTVTDVDASVRWYEAVFGVRFQTDVPHPGGVGKLLADDTHQLMIVLHRHETNDGTLFGETTTGLDHAGFVVPDAGSSGTPKGGIGFMLNGGTGITPPT